MLIFLELNFRVLLSYCSESLMSSTPTLFVGWVQAELAPKLKVGLLARIFGTRDPDRGHPVQRHRLGFMNLP